MKKIRNSKKFVQKKRITLRDVLLHMDAKFQRVDEQFTKVDQRFDRIDRRLDNMDVRFSQIDQRLNRLESAITDRIDSLEEDLTATIMDTSKIRRHVGMPVAMEE